MDDLKEIKPEYPDTNLKKRIQGDEILGAPYKALTTAVAGTLSSGGAGMTNGDFNILTAAVTRVNEMEQALKKLGLIK